MKWDSGFQHTGESGRGELLVLRAGPGGDLKRLWKVGRSRSRGDSRRRPAVQSHVGAGSS